MKPVKIYGESPSIRESLRTAELIAVTDVTTLILGEIGTGKELFAKYICQKSPRNNKPFQAINCAAFSETGIESGLFGYKQKKTDSENTIENQRGYIAQTQGGTLFLDKIEELPLAIQSKLLHFLETGECQATGSSEFRQYNVRIIAASNKNLLEEVNLGRFREDLFYRLNIVPLELPTLKERMDDTALLLKLFFQDLVKEYKLTPPDFSKEAQQYINQYQWPGNVRELRNFCERILILSAGKKVDVSNLPLEIQQQKKKASPFIFELPAQGIQLEALEMDLYKQAIQTSHGNKSAAARLLGLSRDAFLYRLKKYGLR
jgi:DNA-binding NtrC family response regulator